MDGQEQVQISFDDLEDCEWPCEGKASPSKRYQHTRVNNIYNTNTTNTNYYYNYCYINSNYYNYNHPNVICVTIKKEKFMALAILASASHFEHCQHDGAGRNSFFKSSQ
eukprot:759342-Hanusia_phi.AAC.1